jgi:hypothetical protein
VNFFLIFSWSQRWWWWWWWFDTVWKADGRLFFPFSLLLYCCGAEAKRWWATFCWGAGISFHGLLVFHISLAQHSIYTSVYDLYIWLTPRLNISFGILLSYYLEIFQRESNRKHWLAKVTKITRSTGCHQIDTEKCSCRLCAMPLKFFFMYQHQAISDRDRPSLSFLQQKKRKKAFQDSVCVCVQMLFLVGYCVFHPFPTFLLSSCSRVIFIVISLGSAK